MAAAAWRLGPIIAAVATGLPLGFSLVMWPGWPLALAHDFSAQTLAVGIVSAVALYLYKLGDDQPVRYRTVAFKAVAGGLFGFLAAKAGAGAGLNESWQTAAAGVGGARGPDYLDKISEALAERVKR